MLNTPCPFCEMPPARIVDENDLAFVVRDGFPITPGHTLIIPKRHVQSFFDLYRLEIDALYCLVRVAKQVLDLDYRPDSYNIGINDGPAAGQTIPHVHLHLIPRYHGDTADPRGGVRWLMPSKADYWTDRS